MNRQFKFIPKFLKEKFEHPFIALDIETTGLNARKDNIIGASFSVNGSTGYYTTDWKNLFKALQRSECEIVFHNAVFDYSFIKQAGFSFNQRIHDTMLMFDCLNPDRESLGLKELSKEFLGEESIVAARQMSDWLNSNGLEKEDITKAPKNILVSYAAEDAVNTYGLYVLAKARLAKLREYCQARQIKHDPMFYYLTEQQPLITIVVDMQLRGIKIDCNATAHHQGELTKKIGALTNQLNAENADLITKAEDILYSKKIQDRKKKNKSGTIKKAPPRVIFNWDSNDHLKLLFLHLLKCPITKKTEKGNASLDSSFLTTVSPKYPWVELLLEYKELKKIATTYLNNLLQKQEGGYIHANFHLAGTATGRFSSSGPNLQNLPKRGGVKQLFIPRPNHRFIYADYSQLELRIAAHLSQDKLMLHEYRKDSSGKVQSDLHQQTANFLNITREQAKTVNFAIIYNASGWRVAEIMGWMSGLSACIETKFKMNCKCEGCKAKNLAANKGSKMIEELFGQYVGLKNYVEDQRNFMLKYNFAISYFGRMRRLTNLESENRREFNHALKSGFNLPIQSFGASLCKRSMIKLAKKGYHIVNQIHDSIVIEVPEDNLEAGLEDIKETMETIATLSVPLIAEPKILTSLEEKHVNVEE